MDVIRLPTLGPVTGGDRKTQGPALHLRLSGRLDGDTKHVSQIQRLTTNRGWALTTFLRNLKVQKALTCILSGRFLFSGLDSWSSPCFLTGLFHFWQSQDWISLSGFPVLFGLSWLFLQHVTSFCPFFYFLSPYPQWRTQMAHHYLPDKNPGFPHQASLGLQTSGLVLSLPNLQDSGPSPALFGEYIIFLIL